MEKVVNSYECMFVVSLAGGEEAAKATVSKFTDLVAANAETIKVDDWGRRRLAYPIQDMNDGYYTVVTFKSEGSFPAELERLLTIDETVIREMVIRLEYDPAVKAAEAPVTAEAPAAEEVPAEEAPVAEAPVDAE